MYPEWFLTKNRPKNRRENRGERRERGFGEPLVVDSGESIPDYRIYLENGKSYMTSERGIFLVFQW